MRRRGGGPKTKSVVMLGGENDSLKTAFLRDADPLMAIQIRGIKQVWILCPETGAAASKRIYAEMREQRQLILLPRQLRRRGQGSERLGRLRGVEAG